MPESQSSKKKTSTSKKKTSSASKSAGKSSTSNKKGVKSEKKADGFKKFYIPVKVINTPKIEERRRLQSVPETVESQKQEQSNGLSSSSKRSKVSSIKKKEKKGSSSLKKKRKEKNAPEDIPSDQVHASDSDIKDFTPQKNKTVSEQSSEKSSKKTSAPRTFSFSMYRKLAVTFVVLTVLLLAGVFYFSFPGLQITVVPQKQDISDSLTVDVHNDSQKVSDSSGSAVTGTVEEITVTQEKTFQSTGAETIGKEIQGKVRIINNYTQDQPLVETTRLLSPEEKLYRLEEKVVVPSGGSEEVEVYTEDPSPEMAIDPTEFTIPGLWAGLQDDIYAESEEAFEYRVQVQRYVQQSDIDQALEKIRKSLKQKVKDKFGDGYKGRSEVVFQLRSDSIETSVDAEAGEEKEEFTVQIKGDVQVVAFENEKMADLASKKLTVLTPDNKELTAFNKEKMEYKLASFSSEEEKATVKASFQGEMMPSQNSDVINRDKIVDLNKDQVRSYLDGIEEIKDYKLDFSPSFIQTVPNLTDRIKIDVQVQ